MLSRTWGGDAFNTFSVPGGALSHNSTLSRLRSTTLRMLSDWRNTPKRLVGVCVCALTYNPILSRISFHILQYIKLLSGNKLHTQAHYLHKEWLSFYNFNLLSLWRSLLSEKVGYFGGDSRELHNP